MRLSDSRLLSFIAVVLLSFGLLTGCDKDNPTTLKPDQEDYLWIHYKSDSIKVEFASLPKIDTDGEEAIQLSSFISTALVQPYQDKNGNLHDTRRLYSYQIVGDDGFSTTVKGYPNNIWEHLALGHILTKTRQVVFPDDKIDLPGAYNVKFARHIYIHRKFDVVTPESVSFMELRKLTPIPVNNSDGVSELALPLKDFLSPFVSNPESRQYSLVAVDGYQPPTDLTWSQIQTGYWLLTSEITLFTDPALSSGKYKLKVLEKILVK